MPYEGFAPRLQAFAAERSDQERRFYHCAEQFAAVYERLEQTSRGAPLPEWAGALFPRPPLAFLQIEGLRRDLFFSGPAEALEAGRLHAAEYFTAPECDLLLPEDLVGVPPIIDVPRPLTSTNRLWDTHYLARFERATGHLLGQFSSIVLCGGGYGDLPRLLRRRNPHAMIVVLDTPLNAALQWLYLSSVIGERAVRLVTDPGAERPDGYLHLSTTALAPALGLRCEVFMAPVTSHPEAATVAPALDLDCFGAQHFLIAFFDDATPFAAEVRARAAGVVALPGLEPKSLAYR